MSLVRDLKPRIGSRGRVHMTPVSLTRLRKLLRVLAAPEYRHGLRHGVAAAVEHERIPLRADFATVIDAGANRGQFALFATRRFPGANLICFEPLPEARRTLTNIVDGNGLVRVLDVGLGAANEDADFHVAAADDSSSLLPIGARQRRAFPGTQEREQIRIRVRRLDDVLGPVDLRGSVLLKIDVQGSELGVLAGADGLLGAIECILVEASFVELYDGQVLVDEVWEFLNRRGFRCCGVWSVTYGSRGDCLQADFLFARGGFEPLVDG